MADTAEKISTYCRSVGIADIVSGSRAIVVGFSGGADSTLLLSLIGELFPNLYVAAAHLDHGLRGKEAERDRDFCRAFCEERKIRFFEERADISAFAEENDESIEEAGRELRYKFFDKCRSQLAKELSCSEGEVLAATAHNADDNLETVIFNLTRGSGLRGLRGIVPARDNKYIRPLLCLTSKEIRCACRERGIEYVEDTSNNEDEYTRNRIRHAVIPVLEEINPGVQKTVLASCRSLYEDEKYLDEAADKALSGCKGPFPADALRALPPAVASRVVRKLCSSVSDEAPSAVHVEAILSAVSEGKRGRIHLPGGVTAYYGGELEFVAEEDKGELPPFSFDATFGDRELPECGCSIGFFPDEVSADSFFASEKPNIYKELIYKVYINDKIKNNLFVRNRKDADVYFFRSHHRKLKKLMCDAGIPQRCRSRIPVVCDAEGIVWVPGFPVRDGLSAKDEKEVSTVITYCILRKGDGNE